MYGYLKPNLYSPITDIVTLILYSTLPESIYIIIFVTIQRWKFLPFSLMYYKNESIAHRPIRCVIVFENPDRNIAMDPLDIMECMPMYGSLKPNFYSPITYIVTLILYRALPE